MLEPESKHLPGICAVGGRNGKIKQAHLLQLGVHLRRIRRADAHQILHCVGELVGRLPLDLGWLDANWDLQGVLLLWMLGWLLVLLCLGLGKLLQQLLRI